MHLDEIFEMKVIDVPPELAGGIKCPNPNPPSEGDFVFTKRLDKWKLLRIREIQDGIAKTQFAQFNVNDLKSICKAELPDKVKRHLIQRASKLNRNVFVDPEVWRG